MKQERHILALSGGKDSAALAVYLREKYPHLDLEYVFTDSGCELPETYEYLDRIRAVLNIDITVVKPEKGWDDYWALTKVKKTPYGTFTYLPSPKNRWCTEVLKLIPYEKWINERFPGCIVHSYVGLRADEARERKGLIARNPYLKVHFPFIEDGLVYKDIRDLLVGSGLGFPAYYSWRKRSGCYFCFYQTKKEWLGLYEHHPSLYYKAMKYETYLPEKGIRFTWCQDISLGELLNKKEQFQHSGKNGVENRDLKTEYTTCKLLKTLRFLT
ncbi:hypothetical protein H0A61_02543 [Koleobacter methoxysyntrophicus]|uniref:Phosphoadenosine phosphosulphate reductase domain-containing protein n=1 Tax=Koleobacter methoxysyntrophicus TaxID=2751313 RepID=A0A8A0RQB5_9FIRM|nr:phosphoadenosine phosphosulfate reductase family protein [Koleobacter methoxysyntrophicus]QSQ10144.1 hypothetical protein H0A61_02543 [Koleobacter methoxysyntrophicus]